MTVVPALLIVVIIGLEELKTISNAEMWKGMIWLLFTLYPKICETIMDAL